MNIITRGNFLCGDFNARVGDESDFIEGVDDVPIRHVIDNVSNAYGTLFGDFLTDCNLCMLNGRFKYNDFTHKSVVDYAVVPHEQLSLYEEFKVHTMSDLINSMGLVGHDKVPDHSVIEFNLKFKTLYRSVDSDNTGNVHTVKRYHVDNLPPAFSMIQMFLHKFK